MADDMSDKMYKIIKIKDIINRPNMFNIKKKWST